MKKTWLLLVLALGIILLLSLNSQSNSQNQRTITVNGKTIAVEIADTPTERSLGLSGRDLLKPGHGLLFVFDESGYYNFWMKEMNFAIDIIWLDENLNIVDTKLSATPASYPEIFTPKNKAKYVLETNPGEIPSR